MEISKIKNIVETVLGDGRFTIFGEALNSTKLNTVLVGSGPFMVCVPIDDAFKKLPAESLNEILKDPEGRLKQIMLYHILFGRLAVTDIKKLNFPKTKLGITVEITEKGGFVWINDSKVIIPDIYCSNGIIHAIDEVLLPKKWNFLK